MKIRQSNNTGREVRDNDWNILLHFIKINFPPVISRCLHGWFIKGNRAWSRFKTRELIYIIIPYVIGRVLHEVLRNMVGRLLKIRELGT